MFRQFREEKCAIAPTGLPASAGSSAPKAPAPVARPTGHVPDCWTRFGNASPGFPTATGPVLFLHELRTPTGQRRLVAITGVFQPSELPLFISGYDAEAQMIEPGTWKVLP